MSKMDASSCAKEQDKNENEKWARLIERKEEEVKKLHEKEQRLCQKELFYQREKEVLLTQNKHVCPDKPDWRGEVCTSVEPNTADKRHKEKQARKMLAEVDDALKLEKKGLSGFGLETPLLKWNLKIKNYIKMNEEKHNQNIPSPEKSLSLTDKVFYHVNYQTNDVHHQQHTMPLGRHKHQSFPGKWLEKLSFSTRHNGTCVHVTIARKDSKPLCSSKSPFNSDNGPEGSESYVFSTDPHVNDCQQLGMELLLRNDQPEKFIRDVVWNYIDTETS